jgi:hypothetical protein
VIVLELYMDLAGDELRRRAEMTRAAGPDWDPGEQLAGEEQALALLYSGLDADQTATYRELVAAGVLSW